SHHEEPPGERRGNAVPFGHLLCRPGAEGARRGLYPGPDRREGLQEPDRDDTRAAQGVLSGGDLSPELRVQQSQPALRAHGGDDQGAQGAREVREPAEEAVAAGDREGVTIGAHWRSRITSRFTTDSIVGWDTDTSTTDPFASRTDRISRRFSRSGLYSIRIVCPSFSR